MPGLARQWDDAGNAGESFGREADDSGDAGDAGDAKKASLLLDQLHQLF